MKERYGHLTVVEEITHNGYKNIVAYVTVGMKRLYIDQTYYQVEPKVVDVEIIKIGINIKI